MSCTRTTRLSFPIEWCLLVFLHGSPPSYVSENMVMEAVVMEPPRIRCVVAPPHPTLNLHLIYPDSCQQSSEPRILGRDPACCKLDFLRCGYALLLVRVHARLEVGDEFCAAGAGAALVFADAGFVVGFGFGVLGHGSRIEHGIFVSEVYAGLRLEQKRTMGLSSAVCTWHWGGIQGYERCLVLGRV